MQSRVDFDATRRSSTAVNFDATKGQILRKKKILIVFLSKLSVVNRASKKYNRIRKVIDLVLFFTRNKRNYNIISSRSIPPQLREKGISLERTIFYENKTYL